jgi:hypothetical protein
MRDEWQESFNLPNIEGDPLREWKSDIEGILLSGGTNTIECKPVETQLLLVERIA